MPLNLAGRRSQSHQMSSFHEVAHESVRVQLGKSRIHMLSINIMNYNIYNQLYNIVNINRDVSIID